MEKSSFWNDKVDKRTCVTLFAKVSRVENELVRVSIDDKGIRIKGSGMICVGGRYGRKKSGGMDI